MCDGYVDVPEEEVKEPYRRRSSRWTGVVMAFFGAERRFHGWFGRGDVGQTLGKGVETKLAELILQAKPFEMDR